MPELDQDKPVWIKNQDSSPKMTIASLSGTTANCIWFDKDGEHKRNYPINILTNVGCL